MSWPKIGRVSSLRNPTLDHSNSQVPTDRRKKPRNHASTGPRGSRQQGALHVESSLSELFLQVAVRRLLANTCNRAHFYFTLVIDVWKHVWFLCAVDCPPQTIRTTVTVFSQHIKMLNSHFQEKVIVMNHKPSHISHGSGWKWSSTAFLYL